MHQNILCTWIWHKRAPNKHVNANDENKCDQMKVSCKAILTESDGQQDENWRKDITDRFENGKYFGKLDGGV